MKTNKLASLVTISLLLTLIPELTHSVSTSSEANDKSYVKKACLKTQDSTHCFNSLSKYSNAIHSDPDRLCRFAARLAREHASEAKRGAAAIAKIKTLTESERAVARDCAETMDEAAEELGMCYEAVVAAEGLSPGKKRRKVRLANAMTWASAALTDDDTCTDEMAEMRVRAATMRRFRRSVENAARSTSVLLAIMKGFCSS